MGIGIRELAGHDEAAARRLLSSEFRDHFDTGEPLVGHRLCLGAFDGSVLVGVVTLCDEESGKHDFQEILPYPAPAGAFWVLEYLAVAPEARRQGIGTLLLDRGLQEAAGRGAGKVYAASLLRDDGQGSTGLLKSAGFVTKALAALTEGQACGYCGQEPCACLVALMVRSR